MNLIATCNNDTAFILDNMFYLTGLGRKRHHTPEYWGFSKPRLSLLVLFFPPFSISYSHCIDYHATFMRNLQARSQCLSDFFLWKGRQETFTAQSLWMWESLCVCWCFSPLHHYDYNKAENEFQSILVTLWTDHFTSTTFFTTQLIYFTWKKNSLSKRFTQKLLPHPTHFALGEGFDTTNDCIDTKTAVGFKSLVKHFGGVIRTHGHLKELVS